MENKILYFVTEDWYFCSHRLPLAVAAKEAGYEVSVVTRVRSHGEIITSAGLKLVPLDLSRSSKNPVRELKTIIQLVMIYRREEPSLVHHVALKPVLYGTIAARLNRVPSVVNAMAGLGLIFSSDAIKAKLIRPVFQLLFKTLLNTRNSRMILQNSDDVRAMCDRGILRIENVKLIRGSGVNIERFAVKQEVAGVPVVILASRLLWDKGVGEFVEAARILKNDGVEVRFALVGEGDEENPRSIPNKQIAEWRNQGVVEIWGRREDMPDVFAESHIVCLPSFYGEGVPKVLIEAASCGRPIVTTDSPGCREIVKDGLNGILVAPRNAGAVAEAIKQLVTSPELRKRMGEYGRNLVEQEYSLDRVNQDTLALYEELQQ